MDFYWLHLINSDPSWGRYYTMSGITLWLCMAGCPTKCVFHKHTVCRKRLQTVLHCCTALWVIMQPVTWKFNWRNLSSALWGWEIKKDNFIFNVWSVVSGGQCQVFMQEVSLISSDCFYLLNYKRIEARTIWPIKYDCTIVTKHQRPWMLISCLVSRWLMYSIVVSCIYSLCQ